MTKKKKPFRSGNNQFNTKWELKSGARLGRSDLIDLISQMTDTELRDLEDAIKKEKSNREGFCIFGETEEEEDGEKRLS